MARVRRDGLSLLAEPSVSERESENEDKVEGGDECNGKVSHIKVGLVRQRRRTTSEFHNVTGLMLSTTYLTATFGGAPAFYSLWLSDRCTSTVVVHLQFTSDSLAAKSVVVKLSCDRIVFTPDNALEPQIVRVEMMEQFAATNVIAHRMFSLDVNYDRIPTQDVVVKTEKSKVGSLLSLGGALVHKRKNAKGEIMEPRFAANRTIDLFKALAVPTVAVATAEEDTGSSVFLTACSSPSSPTHHHTHHQQTSSELSSSMFVSHMAGGNSFSAVVVKNQGGAESLLTWGMNANGELGIGSTTPMLDPTHVPIPRQLQGESFSVMSVSCGKQHAAIVTSQGRLFSWGNNKYGQLGLGDYTNVDTPHEVFFTSAVLRVSHQRALRIKHTILENGSTNVTQVACGAFHTLFVTHQQHILSMGYNQAGQLGIGHRLQHHKGWRSCTPVMIDTLSDSCILDLSAGQNHSACVVSNGDLYVWGCAGDGRLGVPLTVPQTSKDPKSPSQNQNQSDCHVTPVAVLSLKDLGIRVRTVRCGSRHMAVISDRDLLYVWGANEFGQLGVGDNRTRTRPCLLQFQPFLLDGVVDVALGEFHSSCLTWTGKAYVWGLDLSGEQSIKLDQRFSPEPIELPGNEIAVKIACGWSHTMLLTQRTMDATAQQQDGEEPATARAKPTAAGGYARSQGRQQKKKDQVARYQEAAKWRRVSSAIAVMGRLQHRMNMWKQSGDNSSKTRKKKTSANNNSPVKETARETRPKKKEKESETGKKSHEQRRKSLASGLAATLLVDNESPENAVVRTMAKVVIRRVVEEATARVTGGRQLQPQPRAPSRPAQRKRISTNKAKKPTTAPTKRPVQLQGVFYHNALQSLLPPALPPPCSVPVVGLAVSPRATTVGSPVPTPPPLRSTNRPATASPSPRTLKGFLSTNGNAPLSASSGSLLSALGDGDGDDVDTEQLRPATEASVKKKCKRTGKSKRLAVESLFHEPSFSISSHVTAKRLPTTMTFR